jgi:hypothetical protein
MATASSAAPLAGPMLAETVDKLTTKSSLEEALLGHDC